MGQAASASARIFYPTIFSIFLVAAVAGAPATARPVGDTPPSPNLSVSEVEPGDTIEGMLREFGFEGQPLFEIILGFSSQLDPRHLEPGDRIEVLWSDRAAGTADRVTLRMGDESIELETTGIFPYAEPAPELAWSERAVTVTVDETVIGSLENAGAPAAVGLDVAAALGGLVDFSSEMQGGETVVVMYREAFLPDGEPAGRVDLRYARLEIGDRMMELARDGAPAGPVQVFEDGQPVRVSAAPVAGARISSLFGNRKHPILGRVRMHSGVDYAARTGTPVYASAPGTVIHAGPNGGYGNFVEIRHDDELTTRYAHLSAFADGLKAGQRVEAGERIGNVGATGLATGPNLHYEVRQAGTPVDPLADERIAALARPVTAEPFEAVLQGLREAVVQALDVGNPHPPVAATNSRPS